MRGTEMSSRLREMLAYPGGVLALGVGDAFWTKVLFRKGYCAAYGGGYFAAARLGLLDKGIYPSDFMIEHGRELACAADIPVVIDMDEAGPAPANIQHNIARLLETTAVAMFHVEDQVTPKRCGQHAGKQVHDLRTAIQRMKCVADTREKTRKDCLFMARTDAFVAAGHVHDETYGGDMKAVIDRGNAYADIGADVIWCEFPSSRNRRAFESFAKGIHQHHPHIPLGFNISPSNEWRAGSVTREELNHMGYQFLFCTYGLLYAELLRGGWVFADMFKRNPTVALAGLQDELKKYPDIGSINEFLGIAEATAFEKKYDPSAAQRFISSEGHQ